MHRRYGVDKMSILQGNRRHHTGSTLPKQEKAKQIIQDGPGGQTKGTPH